MVEVTEGVSTRIHLPDGHFRLLFLLDNLNIKHSRDAVDLIGQVLKVVQKASNSLDNLSRR